MASSPELALDVAAFLGVVDIRLASSVERNAWKQRHRWRLAFAASRDHLWASLALEADAGASIVAAEVFACSESCDRLSRRPSLIQSLKARRAGYSKSSSSPGAGTQALCALVRAAARRQPWRLLEIPEESGRGAGCMRKLMPHPVLALLSCGVEPDEHFEEALAVLISPDALNEAGKQREKWLSANGGSCKHRKRCSRGALCQAVEAYAGQFIVCSRCDEAFYCSSNCAKIHYAEGHQSKCRGVLRSSVPLLDPEVRESQLFSAACPECIAERRKLIEPFAEEASQALSHAWGDWRSLGQFLRQPAPIVALGAACFELLAVAAGESFASEAEAFLHFRRNAMSQAQLLVAQLRSFPDALAAGTVPAAVLRRIEGRMRQLLGHQAGWADAARSSAPTGCRAAEALGAWLAAVMKAAAAAPQPQPCPQLRSVSNYRALDGEAVIGALCGGRRATQSLIRMLGQLQRFMALPLKLLQRSLDFGGSVQAVKCFLAEPWLPPSGLDASILVQVCSMELSEESHGQLLESVAARSEPDGKGLQALWGLSARPSSAGRVALAATGRWQEVMPRSAVEAAMLTATLEVPDLSEELEQGAIAADLQAMEEALSSKWLEGLRLSDATPKQIYSRRPLSSTSVRLIRLASRGLTPKQVEDMLADTEPFLWQHDSRGIVELLDWLGRERPGSRPLLVRLLHRLLGNDNRSNKSAGQTPKTRATVEAVECLLSACPRLARSPLAIKVEKSNGDGNLERLLPLQTLCLSCEEPGLQTASLAQALLRRHPEASDHPLPRSFRYTARGAGFNVYVCSAATALQSRCLAAEEAGKDSVGLRTLLEVVKSHGSSGHFSPDYLSRQESDLAVSPTFHGQPGGGRAAPRPPATPPPQWGREQRKRPLQVRSLSASRVMRPQCCVKLQPPCEVIGTHALRRGDALPPLRESFLVVPPPPRDRYRAWGPLSRS